MARLNIEDSIFTDRRWIDLVIKMGSPEAAMGALILMWLTAQKYWKKDKSRIPRHVWNEQKLNQNLIETGWVTWQENYNGFYAEGSEKQFDWLVSRQNSGQIGGNASAASRISKNNDLGASKRKQTQANASKFNPLTLTHSLTLTQTLKNNNKTNAQFDLESLYKIFPRKEGKSRGLKIAMRDVKSEQDFLDLKTAIENYSKSIEGTEKKFIKHFSTFMGEWKDWIDLKIETEREKRQQIVERTLQELKEKRERENVQSKPNETN